MEDLIIQEKLLVPDLEALLDLRQPVVATFHLFLHLIGERRAGVVIIALYISNYILKTWEVGSKKLKTWEMFGTIPF